MAEEVTRAEVALRRSRFRGCLLGGAVGDALGAPVEFSSLAEIRRVYGERGLTDYAPAYGRLGAFTDDTQMTLFTADGLVRAVNRFEERGVSSPPDVVRLAYLRWFATQNEAPPPGSPRGWLDGLPELHARRAPGATCLAALAAGGRGTPEAPANSSKGCGGVRRVAPAGLVARDSFRLGCELAALTHGHPSGYLAAGFFARLVESLARGDDLRAAIGAARAELARAAGHEECSSAVERALSAAARLPASPESVESLGGGWVAEEAVAIALFAALKASGFRDGVLLAVNHGGDSDSTGSMAGTLLGLVHGVEVIPPEWLARLELRDAIERVADDLAYASDQPRPTREPGRDRRAARRRCEARRYARGSSSPSEARR